MDAADRALLAASVAAAIDSLAPPAANDAALMDLGWADMLAVERVDTASVVFGELGRAAARSSLLDDVVCTALGVAMGETLVHPQWGKSEPTEHGTTRHLRLDGTATRARLESAEAVHVVLRDGVAVVDTTSLDLGATHRDGDLAAVVIDGPVSDWVPHDPDTIGLAVTAARRALAHQLHGLATGMLALARQHAVDRVQFGRPIGSFQAVRHKLAETHVAVEATGEALMVASEGPPLAVDLGRVLAGRAAITAGRHCQQVLAGIGFTRDHDFHRFLFSSIEIDGLYGTTARLTQQLGQQLLADRSVPRTVDL